MWFVCILSDIWLCWYDQTLCLCVWWEWFNECFSKPPEHWLIRLHQAFTWTRIMRGMLISRQSEDTEEGLVRMGVWFQSERQFHCFLDLSVIHLKLVPFHMPASQDKNLRPIHLSRQSQNFRLVLNYHLDIKLWLNILFNLCGMSTIKYNLNVQ